MRTHKARGLIAASTLSEDQLREIQALRDVCNAHEGLVLKVHLAPGDTSRPPRKFLYYDRGALVGYAELEGGGYEAELCGMVHPRHRRHGIGRELLEAARGACRREGVERLLVICEDASRSGRAFVAALGASQEFSELHLEMDAQAGVAAQTPRLLVRQADEADAGAVAHVITESFGGDEDRVRRRVEAELLEAGARYYVGELAGRVIGTLKVYPDGENAGIYAFGILPTDRKRGYGRELLGEVIERMRREGHGHAYLEVDDDNEPAQRLYRAMGFVHTTTYVYYYVPLEP